MLPTQDEAITQHKSTTHEERYVHVQDGEGRTTRFNVALTFSRFHAASAFCRKEDDGKWYCSFAYCVKEDPFSRAVGRQVARRKYFSNKTVQACIGTEYKHELVLDAMFNNLPE